MKCLILVSGKNKKKNSKCPLLKILPRVLSIKTLVFLKQSDSVYKLLSKPGTWDQMNNASISFELNCKKKKHGKLGNLVTVRSWSVNFPLYFSSKWVDQNRKEPVFRNPLFEKLLSFEILGHFQELFLAKILGVGIFGEYEILGNLPYNMQNADSAWAIYQLIVFAWSIWTSLPY